MSAQKKAERQISSVGTDGGNKGSSLVDKIKGSAYSDKQFRSLSPEDKRHVQKFRNETKKKKRKDKAKHRKEEKRKLAKLKSDKEAGSGDVETESTNEKPAGSNAGAQFGANGNEAKKSKPST